MVKTFFFLIIPVTLRRDFLDVVQVVLWIFDEKCVYRCDEVGELVCLSNFVKNYLDVNEDVWDVISLLLFCFDIKVALTNSMVVVVIVL